MFLDMQKNGAAMVLHQWIAPHEALTFLAARVAGDGGDARKALQVGPKNGMESRIGWFFGKREKLVWYDMYTVYVFFFDLYMIYMILMARFPRGFREVLARFPQGFREVLARFRRGSAWFVPALVHRFCR